jgi:uncharacterized membrane protein
VNSADSRLELLIGRVLRIGVLASTTCLAIGLAVSLIRADAGMWLLNAGIVMLLVTPAARVVLSFIEFMLARDWFFVAATGIVLIELAAGVVAALVFHRRM